MAKEKLHKKDYESIYDCIVSDQVSPDRINNYFQDKKFYKYWKNRRQEDMEINLWARLGHWNAGK